MRFDWKCKVKLQNYSSRVNESATSLMQMCIVACVPHCTETNTQKSQKVHLMVWEVNLQQKRQKSERDHKTEKTRSRTLKHVRRKVPSCVGRCPAGRTERWICWWIDSCCCRFWWCCLNTPWDPRRYIAEKRQKAQVIPSECSTFNKVWINMLFPKN